MDLRIEKRPEYISSGFHRADVGYFRQFLHWKLKSLKFCIFNKSLAFLAKRIIRPRKK